MGTGTTFAVTSQNLLDWQLQLINQLSTYTLEYLGIAVAVVLALGGAFYFFTLKPFERELARQASEIKDAKDSIQQAFHAELAQLRQEMAAVSSKIDIKVADTLEKHKQQTLELVGADIATAISGLKESMLSEIRVIDKKISDIFVTEANHGKDIGSVQSGQRVVETKLNDIEIRLRAIETRSYSQDGKMGAILIPVRTIKELVGKQNEWRIGDWLETLKKEITGIKLDADTKAEITECMEILPKKYQISKDEILKLISTETTSINKT